MKRILKIFSALSITFIMCSCGLKDNSNSSIKSDSTISSSDDSTGNSSIESTYDLSGVCFNNKRFTYDGNKHSLELTGVLPTGLKVLYENNAQTEVGEYTVVAKVMTIDKEETINEYEASLIIDKANYDLSTIKFESKEYLYDGNDKSISISGTLPEGVTVTYEGNNVKEPGEYDVVAHFSHSNGNYNDIEDMKAKIVIRDIPELSTVITDTTKLDLSKDGNSYDGKIFTRDGIGKVSLLKHIDGDTTWFKDTAGKEFSLRYYGINTPESTNKVEPWGYEASAFTKSKLENATEILLQRDTAELQTGNRYLGLVWIKDAQHTDFYCLNLLLIEQAYSKNHLHDTESLYLESFVKAAKNAEDSKKHIYGEKDPNYDYSPSVKEVTVHDVYDNFDEYCQNKMKLHLTAMVSRIEPNGFYVQSIEPNEMTNENRSLYAFTLGQSFGNDVKEGTIVSFYCSAGEFNGQKQLIDVNLNSDGQYKYKVIGQSEVLYEKVDENTNLSSSGLLNSPITTDLTVKSLGNPSSSGDVTLYCTFKGTNKNFDIRISSSLKNLYKEFYTPNINIRVKGILTVVSLDGDTSNPIYQLKLCCQTDSPDIIKIN